MIGVYERMAAELPPPFALPESEEEGTDQLVMFLKLLMRDYLPVGFVQQLAMEAFTQRRSAGLNDEMTMLCRQIARQLTYEPPH